MAKNKDYTFDSLIPFLREVVASPYWSWADGMMCRHPAGIFNPWRYDEAKAGTCEQSSAGLPDLDDPATAGAVLALLAELSPCALRIKPGGEYTGWEIWSAPVVAPPRTMMLGWGATCGIAAAWAIAYGLPKLREDLDRYIGRDTPEVH